MELDTIDALDEAILRRRVRKVLPELTGKTIAGVVVSGGRSPKVKWEFAFTDGTTYEIWCDVRIEGGAHVHDGTMADREADAIRNNRAVQVFSDDHAALVTSITPGFSPRQIEA